MLYLENSSGRIIGEMSQLSRCEVPSLETAPTVISFDFILMGLGPLAFDVRNYGFNGLPLPYIFWS